MALHISHVDHRAGVVTLSDGSRWQVGPGDAGTIARWAPGQPASVTAGRHLREVQNDRDGSRALACPAV